MKNEAPDALHTVFVLGAGFTKAFLPAAPLVEDKYPIWSFLKGHKTLRHALKLVKLEEIRCGKGRVNIESLMTRINGSMPYDSDVMERLECSMLLQAVKQALMERLHLAETNGEYYQDDLKHFAGYCIDNLIPCITFNYDDFLDRNLWGKDQIMRKQNDRTYWHPDGGYGFFCKPSMGTISQEPVAMDQTAMLLLKMHGSTNWYVSLGASKPYQPGSIVHHSTWYRGVPPRFYSATEGELDNLVLRHLEPDPFIVPPVLAKSDFLEQPILKLIWSLAYQELARAKVVVFIGYSLPMTDLAAGYLFAETLSRADCRIQVVNYAKSNLDRKSIKAAYKKVFPKIEDDQFNFDGALKWSRTLDKKMVVGA